MCLAELEGSTFTGPGSAGVQQGWALQGPTGPRCLEGGEMRLQCCGKTCAHICGVAVLIEHKPIQRNQAQLLVMSNCCLCGHCFSSHWPASYPLKQLQL